MRPDTGSFIACHLGLTLTAVLLAGASCQEGEVESEAGAISRQTTVALEERTVVEPDRLPEDLPITATVQTSFLWLEMTPCHFVRVSTGVLARYEVLELFSRMSDARAPGPAPVTFARLHPLAGTPPEHTGSSVWVVYDGGAFDHEFAVTADVALRVGDVVYAVVAPEHWNPDLRAYEIHPASVFTESSPRFLETSAGRVQIGSDALAALLEVRSATDADYCPLAWEQSRTPRREPTGAEGWIVLQPDDDDGDDGAVHFPGSQETNDVPEAGE